MTTRSGKARGTGLRVTLAAVAIPCALWWLFVDTSMPDAPGTLRFAHFGDYHDYELWRSVIEDFEATHPGVEVRQEYVVGLTGRYDTKMRQQIRTGTLPDVALIRLGPFRELADHFADQTEILENSRDGGVPLGSLVNASGVAAFNRGGRQRGLPISGGNLVIYCNRECFDRASRYRGEPIPLPARDWTMERFRRTAALLTCDFDEDGRVDQFGFWLPRWIYYLPFIWSFGADLTDESGREWTLIGPEAEHALAFYRSLMTGNTCFPVGDLSDPLTHRVCPRPEEVPQVFQDVGFLTGQVAMCVNGPWFQPFLAKTRLADFYSIVPVPTGPAGRWTRMTWDGVVMAANRSPARRATARAFIEFLLSRSVQDRIAGTGRALPARRDSNDMFLLGSDFERRALFVEGLAYSRLQAPLPHFAQVDRLINEQLRRLIDARNPISPAEMITNLARDPLIVSTFSNRPNLVPSP